MIMLNKAFKASSSILVLLSVEYKSPLQSHNKTGNNVDCFLHTTMTMGNVCCLGFDSVQCSLTFTRVQHHQSTQCCHVSLPPSACTAPCPSQHPSVSAAPVVDALMEKQ